MTPRLFLMNTENVFSQIFAIFVFKIPFTVKHVQFMFGSVFNKSEDALDVWCHLIKDWEEKG